MFSSVFCTETQSGKGKKQYGLRFGFHYTTNKRRPTIDDQTPSISFHLSRTMYENIRAKDCMVRLLLVVGAAFFNHERTVDLFENKHSAHQMRKRQVRKFPAHIGAGNDFGRRAKRAGNDKDERFGTVGP